MGGVLETAWQPGRSTHGGHAEFQVAVYWHLGGICGGTGVRTVGVYAPVPGFVRWGYAAVLGNRTVGEQRGCMAVLGCPPDPSNNSGGAWGHPLGPVNKLEGPCLRACTKSNL